MSIKVYHNAATDFWTDLEEVLVKDIEFVGEVDTDELDRAFMLTQNVDTSWTKNKLVKTDEKECRSTSVGDVFQRGMEFFVVHKLGFRPLRKLRA